jgi:hypothetical protein
MPRAPGLIPGTVIIEKKKRLKKKKLLFLVFLGVSISKDKAGFSLWILEGYVLHEGLVEAS